MKPLPFPIPAVLFAQDISVSSPTRPAPQAAESNAVSRRKIYTRLTYILIHISTFPLSVVIKIYPA